MLVIFTIPTETRKAQPFLFKTTLNAKEMMSVFAEDIFSETTLVVFCRRQNRLNRFCPFETRFDLVLKEIPSHKLIFSISNTD